MNYYVKDWGVSDNKLLLVCLTICCHNSTVKTKWTNSILNYWQFWFTLLQEHCPNIMFILSRHAMAVRSTPLSFGFEFERPSAWRLLAVKLVYEPLTGSGFYCTGDGRSVSRSPPLGQTFPFSNCEYSSDILSHTSSPELMDITI